jgi:hypothetical protein
MHAGFSFVAFNGSVHGFVSAGLEKRSGGDWANGIPKYAATFGPTLTPSIGPSDMRTVGALARVAPSMATARQLARTRTRAIILTKIEWSAENEGRDNVKTKVMQQWDGKPRRQVIFKARFLT